MENIYEHGTKQLRGHMRSASLENANSILAKNTLGLPIVQPGLTGTLKSKNEQRRLKSKFGSHNNLEEYVGHRKSKFQNLRNMFEMKSDYDINRMQQHKQTVEFNEHLSILENDSMQTHSLPPIDNTDQNKNLVKPIAFKPIPFEPDYSIPNRYNDMCDRYGSTPSLVPAPGSHLKFGSTSDLRHGYSYCSNLLTRRRCSRSLKINDSMESVRQTPDSDATSHSSTKKSSNKYVQDQFDITPSPSDSGVSDLEAALKDRDSELAYLRQTMEHNEKVIFKVHKDKEAFWENETRRLKALYENQQKEYMQKIKKLEQMLTLQSFQFKQNKIRQSEDSTRLKEQFGDLSNENELLRSEIESFKMTEKTLKDRIDQLEEKIEVMDKLIANLKGQLEENEWTVCQKNGEIALLKTQLKEAKLELTSKDHEMVHLKTEVQSRPVHVAEIKKLPETKNCYDSDLEISQLNRIIILKDQVILAMTSELAKLRKELSDLSIYHEYGEEPSGKYSRLKYKIDSLTNICNQEAAGCCGNQPLSLPLSGMKDCVQNSDLDIIINCLKASACFISETNLNSLNAYNSLNLRNLDNGGDYIVNGLEKLNLSNLPDVTLSNGNATNSASNNISSSNNNNPKTINSNTTKNIGFSNVSNSKTIDSITEVENEAERTDILDEKQQLEKITKELDQLRITFETEKQQWADEKEKVMSYQRQLQMHYISMYQKMKELESRLSNKC